MKIGFCGAGRVGCSLGRYFRQHGLEVTGFYNRTKSKAEEAARWTGTLCYESLKDLTDANDVLFLTVSDQAIPETVESLRRTGSLTGKILVHTSGALTSHVFQGTGASGYSIHPLYAISDRENSYQTLEHATFTVEGGPEYLEYWVRTLRSIGLTVKTIGSDDKVRYHAAAVMASNLVCGLYAAAAEELVRCGFSREEAEQALAGLFLDNAGGIVKKGVRAQLTGPLERGDRLTVEKHLKVLDGEHKKIYRELSGEVLRVAEEKNPERDYAGIRTLISDEGDGNERESR